MEWSLERHQFCRQDFDTGSVEGDGDPAVLAVKALEQVAEQGGLIGAGHALPRTVEQISRASQFFWRHLVSA